MLQVSIEIAKTKSEPIQWAQGFMAALYSRIDQNEKDVGPLALELPCHEVARGTLDALGRELLQSLPVPPP
jgi:hypothetical protein